MQRAIYQATHNIFAAIYQATHNIFVEKPNKEREDYFFFSRTIQYVTEGYVAYLQSFLSIC